MHILTCCKRMDSGASCGQLSVVLVTVFYVHGTMHMPFCAAHILTASKELDHLYEQLAQQLTEDPKKT